MLFKDVTNSAEIHKKLLDRTLEPEVALLDPAPIQSLFALHLAAHKAVVDDARGSLTTRTIHSEVVYNMSASKHITEGLRRFGMDDDASAVLACRFDATADDVAATKANVGGAPVPSGELGGGARGDERRGQGEEILSTGRIGGEGGRGDGGGRRHLSHRREGGVVKGTSEGC